MSSQEVPIWLREAVMQGCVEADLSQPHVRRLIRQQVSRGRRISGGRPRRREVCLRATSTGEGIATGIASAWDAEYPVGNGVRERIQKGAFRDSLRRKGNVPLFLQHRWDEPVGVASLSERSTGLHFAGRFFTDTEKGNSVYRAVKAGALRDVSIGFLPQRTRREKRGVLTILQAEVLEVSIVVKGANPAAVVQSVRSSHNS